MRFALILLYLAAATVVRAQPTTQAVPPEPCGLGHRAVQFGGGLHPADAGRPALPDSLDTTHFRIHFTTADGPDRVDPAYVDSVAAVAEHVYAREVVELAQPAPLSDGDGRLDIYLVRVRDFGVEYGLTDSERWTYDGFDGPAPVYLLIDRSYDDLSRADSRGLNGLRVTLAHEFHHAIQAATGIRWDERYFNEMVSVWFEQVIYPEIDDYIQYLPPVFATAPTTLPQSGGYPYGFFLLGIQLRHGLQPTVQSVAKALAAQAEGRPALVGLNAALNRELGSTLARELGDFWTRNGFTGARADTLRGWLDGRRYPTQSATALASGEPAAGQLAPLGARFYRSGDRLIAVYNPEPTAPLLVPYTLTVDASGAKLVATGRPANPAALAGVSLGADLSDIRRFDPTVPTEPAPYPQPFRPGDGRLVHLPVDLASAESVQLTVYRPSGEAVVRRLAKADLRLGHLTADLGWDGLDAAGRPVASGVYLVHLHAAGLDRTVKLVVVRER